MVMVKKPAATDRRYGLFMNISADNRRGFFEAQLGIVGCPVRGLSLPVSRDGHDIHRLTGSRLQKYRLKKWISPPVKPMHQV